MLPEYTKQTVTEINANGEKDWDGTNPLTAQLAVTNNLDTRSITVLKEWYDNNYSFASNLHYKLDITLSSPSLISDSRNDGTASQLYQEVKAIETTGVQYVTFENLPKYDKTGSVIVYDIREDASTKNNPVQRSNAQAVAVVPKTGTADTLPVGYESSFTDGEHHYGYVGHAVYTAAHDGTQTDKAYLTQVDITNTFPLTKIKVNKEWIVAEAYHQYTGENDRDIVVTLIRCSSACCTVLPVPSNGGRTDSRYTPHCDGQCCQMRERSLPNHRSNRRYT